VPASAPEEATIDAAVVPAASSVDAADARVTLDQPASADASSTRAELDPPATPDAADTPETTGAAAFTPATSGAPTPTLDSPAAAEADPTNPEPSDPDLIAPEAAPPVAFDDIVIPPRPPLPGAPAAEAPVAEGIDEHAAVDPTPADVAVEEPVISGPPAAEPSADGPSAAADEPANEDDLEPAASDVELIIATPLDDVDNSPVTSDSTDAGDIDGDKTVAPHDVSGARTFDDTQIDDSQDPTPPDVRSDDEAPADEAPAEEIPAGVTSGTPVPATADTDAEASPDVIAGAGVPADTDAEAVADAAIPAAPDAHASPDVVVAAAVTPADTDVSAHSATDDEASADSAADTAASTDPAADAVVPALTLRHITKTFGELRAVDAIDLTVPAGSFYGLVGPNGAGKTTTLSIIAGLLRADGGAVTINGVDAKKRAREAKKMIGVLPDRLRTFDRLTGRQLLSYYGALRGLPSGLVESRMADLARAFDLVDALARPVSDYSAGMTKKVMLAGAMIHSPRLLVLDEPFEAVDPVSSGVILDILRTYVDHGGTVILSSHGMELVERVCSRVAVIVSGQVLAEGTVDEVRGEGTLEQRFRELSGGLGDVEGLEWLHTFSA
jgi:ABC-2 type transport system ATP-binding protein